uniref:dTDP-4-dehydrorhamnose reductase n=1 Tax=Hymenolepis diminuta TaxID=6216 RepID=A0A0R3SMV2_HYMDI
LEIIDWYNTIEAWKEDVNKSKGYHFGNPLRWDQHALEIEQFLLRQGQREKEKESSMSQ